MKDDFTITLTGAQWDAAKKLADERMKASNGHAFMTILKTRCQHCGRSRNAKGRCGAWFQTFIGNLDMILMNLDREQL